MGGILDKVTGNLEQRFVVNALMPAIVFWTAVVMAIASALSWKRVVAWWDGLAGAQLGLYTVGAAALLVFSGAILASQAGRITRLYEGYWGSRPPGSWLRRIGIRLQTNAFSRLRLEDDRDFERRYRLYPRRKEDLLPTRLGNVLKGAEAYPADDERYAMDAVFFWPRLYAVLPDPMRQTLGSARSSLDLLLTTSLLGLLYAVIAGVTLLGTRSWDWRLWGAEVGGGLIVGLLAYRSALSSATVYTELVRSAFDLYRRDLLKQFGFPPPPTLEAERTLWRNLGHQLYRRGAPEPEVLRFDVPSEVRSGVDGRAEFLKELAEFVSAAVARRWPAEPAGGGTGERKQEQS